MTIVDVTREPDLLRTGWSDGRTARFHHVWLRDNCTCGDCRHPTIPERILDTLTLDLGIEPMDATVADGALEITWPDGHRSVFSSAWLEEYAYEPGFHPAVPSPFTLWRRGELTSPPEVGYDDVMGSDSGLVEYLRQLRRFGVSFVRGAPTEEGRVTEIAERIAFLRNSNFGLIWDVRSKPSADSLAYTAHALSPHTDLVSRTDQPGLQFLHCIVFEATGGDSVLVDGFAVADEVRRTDPAAFETLTTTPVPFRYRSADCDVTMSAAMIRLDHRDEFDEVRYSNALLAPVGVDPDRMTELYRAMRVFTSLLRSEEFALRFRLEPGDVMTFDNHRVLHGRDSFDPQSGPRLLQGCYVDRDDFLSRLRMLDATISPSS